jgi:uncharacterized membrane protein
MTFKGRFGRFLLFLGTLVLVIFLATLSSGSPEYLLCPSGLIIFLLGLYFAITGRKPPEPSGRFRIIRSVQDKLSEEPDQEHKE